MKKAIYIQYNENFEARCQSAAKVGFQDIAIDFYPTLGKSEEEWKRMLDDIRRVLDAHQLECVQVHPYFYHLYKSSEEIEEACEFAIRQAIIASGELDCEWCTIHPRSAVNEGFRRSASFEDNKRMLDGYLELALQNNTGIAVENMPIFKSHLALKQVYSSDYDDLCELVDWFNNERMGICWDFGHANLMAFNQADAIQYMGARLKATHVQNNLQHDDMHLPASCGNIDWKACMSALLEVGYTGALTAEVGFFYNDKELLESYMHHNLICLNYLERCVD